MTKSVLSEFTDTDIKTASEVFDTLIPGWMEAIKADCLSMPFTSERSIIVDQILMVQELMQSGLSFTESVRRLQQ